MSIAAPLLVLSAVAHRRLRTKREIGLASSLSQLTQ
jgi:hypothetical protein